MDPDGRLAPLGLEDIALDADDIADVVLLEILELGLRHLVKLDVELDAPGVILQIAEEDLAHAALAHDAPRQADIAPFHPGKVCLDGGGVRRDGVLRLLEGVAPLLLQSRQLLPAAADRVGHS